MQKQLKLIEKILQLHLFCTKVGSLNKKLKIRDKFIFLMQFILLSYYKN